MIVAIIGDDNFKWGKASTRKFNKKIFELVEKDGARAFLYTGEGNFDLICWLIVTGLHGTYPNILRIYTQSKLEDDDEQFKDNKSMFEFAFLPIEVCHTGVLAEIERDIAMIDRCDVLVTYFNRKKTRMTKTKFHTELAIEYAREKQKRVINLF